ncbi:MAG: sigma-70 family RNA polymerase sigma factor [Oscillospiraceae bacterium]|nr:sigma-70 family RNA polymerase sigma factor [Oscillospiraceae bacterium]
MTREEAGIIKKVLSGDADAYEQLVRANERNVYNLALKMTGNEQDAFDMSQEAFLKAYINLSRFKGDSRFSVWLYRLTYNVCVDFIRKRKRENTVPLERDDGDGQTEAVQVADTRDQPEASIEKLETRREIIRQVQLLPDIYREVIIMRCVEDMSYAQMADALGISEGTVKSRLSRARKILVEGLSDSGTICAEKRQKDSPGGEGR